MYDSTCHLEWLQTKQIFDRVALELGSLMHVKQILTLCQNIAIMDFFGINLIFCYHEYMPSQILLKFGKVNIDNGALPNMEIMNFVL